MCRRLFHHEVVINGTYKDGTRFYKAFQREFKDHPLPPLLCVKDGAVLSSSGLRLSSADVTTPSRELLQWHESIKAEHLARHTSAADDDKVVDSLKDVVDRGREEIVTLNAIVEELHTVHKDLMHECQKPAKSGKRGVSDDDDSAAAASGSTEKKRRSGDGKRASTGKHGNASKTPRT